MPEGGQSASKTDDAERLGEFDPRYLRCDNRMSKMRAACHEIVFNLETYN